MSNNTGTKTKTPHIQEAKELINRWRSCTTDRDRHNFIKALRKAWPDMADRFSKLVEG